MIADPPEVTAPPAIGDHLAVTVDGGSEAIHVLTEVRRYVRHIRPSETSPDPDPEITWVVTSGDGWSAMVRHGLAWSEATGWYSTELEIVALEDYD